MNVRFRPFPLPLKEFLVTRKRISYIEMVQKRTLFLVSTPPPIKNCSFLFASTLPPPPPHAALGPVELRPIRYIRLNSLDLYTFGEYPLKRAKLSHEVMVS